MDKVAIAALTSKQFQALFHQLLGAQMLRAEHLVRLAFSFVDVRPADRVFLMDLALELASVYPGASEDEASQRRALASSTSDATEFEDAVLRFLEERRARLATLTSLPEATSGRDGLREYRLFEARRTQRAMNAGQRRSVFAQIATHQPIACGESTTQRPAGGERITFSRHEFSVELPTLGTIDPIGNALQRIHHLNLADSLLAEEATSP